MIINRNISEIRAEVLLNYLYPGMEDHWVAHCDGTFYRNYNGDSMAIDEETGEVRLSRDGFVKLLPQGLITSNNELKGEDAAQKFKELERRQRLLHEAFLPFDTYAFHKKLAIERQASDLLVRKLDFLLKEYFGFDLAKVDSPLVREAAVLLPYVCHYKGDLGFVSKLLATLLKCEVRMCTGRYSQTDSTVRWLPKVRYELLMPNLTTEQYREQCEAIKPLVSFLREWLIPFDVHCEILVKEHGAPQRVGERLTLNYNMELK